MTYNFDENLGDNHYNCPVVAYYPEVISSNIQKLKDTVFIGDYVGLHRRHDFPGKMYEILRRHFPNGTFTKKDVKKASDAAYAEYDQMCIRDRVFIGVCGAFGHNLAQLLVALWMTGFGALGYIPALALYSVVCGICTGLLLQVLLPLLEKLPVLRK